MSARERWYVGGGIVQVQVPPSRGMFDPAVNAAAAARYLRERYASGSRSSFVLWLATPQVRIARRLRELEAAALSPAARRVLLVLRDAPRGEWLATEVLARAARRHAGDDGMDAMYYALVEIDRRDIRLERAQGYVRLA